MSWWIKAVGTPANVAAEVQKVAEMPECLKQAVSLVAGQVKDGDYNNGVSVETQGHLGGASSSAKLTVELIRIAPSPEAAT